MACISRFAAAILSGETELALGTIRVKSGFYCLHILINLSVCKLSILHSTLFSAFLFVSAYYPFIMMFSIIWFLLLPRTFFPFIITSSVVVTSPCSLYKSIIPSTYARPVHDARAERSKQNKEGLNGKEVWGAAVRL